MGLPFPIEDIQWGAGEYNGGGGTDYHWWSFPIPFPSSVLAFATGNEFTGRYWDCDWRDVKDICNSGCSICSAYGYNHIIILGI